MRLPETLKEYKEVAQYIANTNPKDCYRLTRTLIRMDLFFLLRFACGRKDMEHPWLIERCKEVQNAPNGYLDLWSREHFKSSIITYGLTIKDILSSHGDDPMPEWKGLEPTFGIFACTRPIAKAFLSQIKREFESNQLLKAFFPDVIWDNPWKDATKWSEDGGIVLKRKANPKESTVEAWGLVEGQPTSKHYDVLIYDDIVTLESVRSPEMIKKTLESWEVSINLGAGEVRRRHIGTRYHYNDTYRELMKRKAVIPRIYGGTDNGEIDGKPLLKSQEWMSERLRLLGSYTFACQILQNPVADKKQTMKKEWMRFHGGHTGEGTNRYLLVDPSGEKKKSSDYTCMFVIGLAPDNNYYVLDIIRDRLNLTERGEMLFNLHKKWKPLGVGYETYGMQADIEYIKEKMKRENYHFEITPLGGQIPKVDRIKRLYPSFEQSRWYFPESLYYVDYQNTTMDLIDVYLNEEFLAFPVSVHDDMLDCQSRIIDADLNAIWPRAAIKDDKHDRYSRRKRTRTVSGWAS